MDEHRITPNFTWAEFERSDTAARNNIDNKIRLNEFRQNIERLCRTLLEPIREMVDRPVVVTSGYRCLALNRAIGGAKKSAHQFGRAADIRVPGTTPAALFDEIAHSGIEGYDQLILEFDRWVHAAIAPLAREPRGQRLIASHSSTGVIYTNADMASRVA